MTVLNLSADALEKIDPNPRRSYTLPGHFYYEPAIFAHERDDLVGEAEITSMQGAGASGSQLPSRSAAKTDRAPSAEASMTRWALAGSRSPTATMRSPEMAMSA